MTSANLGGLDAKAMSAIKDLLAGSKEFLTKIGQYEPLRSVYDAFETSGGQIGPVLDQIRERGGDIEKQIIEHPTVAAVGAALIIKMLREQGKTRAALNALSLREIFTGDAGPLAKGFISLEGHNAGKVGARVVVDSMETVSDKAASVVGKDNGVPDQAVVELAANVKKSSYGGRYTVTINQAGIEGWTRAQKERLRQILDSSGTSYRFEDGRKGLTTPQRIQEGAISLGAFAGAVLVYQAADKLSNDIHEKLKAGFVPPSAPETIIPTGATLS